MNKLGNKVLVALAAVAAFVLVGAAGCDDTKGTVLNVYGPAETKATAKCNLAGSWSLSIDTDGTEQGITKVCVSEATAKKYKVGSTYP